MDSLGVVTDAIARADETLDLATRHLDSSLVDVLRILGFDKDFVSAQGSYLYDAAGRPHLDFHTGEGFASLGHNHPDVREVLQATLAADLVDGVQIHFSALAGILAEALSARLPDGLDAVFFASAGAEAVDSAMKFARAATGRPRLISCDSSFHGVTLGPLSMVGDEFFKEGFGPLLPGCERVPFGDLDRLERELRRKDVAAFFVEPVQGRMVTLPPAGYLHAAQELCRRYGTLFVADEIQTGLGRTGKWFALEPVEVAERDALAAGEQRSEALLEELVAHHRQWPERDAVEAAVAGDEPRPARRRAGELHRGVHRLGPRAREEDGVEPVGQPRRERLREHPGQRREVDLHAVDEVGRERGLQHLAHVRVVVAETREALAGMEVEVRAAGGVVQVGP
ncbi:MAG TPA: aminotransferase class III-fold pyridoxal phosphate-dependent enzyme, partial [Thermoleophilaceae bacterium]